MFLLSSFFCFISVFSIMTLLYFNSDFPLMCYKNLFKAEPEQIFSVSPIGAQNTFVCVRNLSNWNVVIYVPVFFIINNAMTGKPTFNSSNLILNFFFNGPQTLNYFHIFTIIFLNSV
jgi:hypothetical protein